MVSSEVHFTNEFSPSGLKLLPSWIKSCATYHCAMEKVLELTGKTCIVKPISHNDIVADWANSSLCSLFAIQVTTLKVGSTSRLNLNLSKYSVIKFTDLSNILNTFSSSYLLAVMALLFFYGLVVVRGVDRQRVLRRGRMAFQNGGALIWQNGPWLNCTWSKLQECNQTNCTERSANVEHKPPFTLRL